MSRAGVVFGALSLCAAMLVAPVVSAVQPEAEPVGDPQPEPRPEPGNPTPETYWESIGGPAAVTPEREPYWGQIAVADGIAIGATWYVFHEHGNVFVPYVPFLLAGPIIHAVHGDFGAAGASLLLKVGIPFATGLIGVALNKNDCPAGQDPGECFDLSGVLFGFAAGMVIATALDAGVLTPSLTRPSPTLAPVVSVSGSGATVIGLAGTFF